MGFPQEEDLLHTLSKGDAAALHRLFDMYYTPLCYFAEKLTGDHAEAEDMVMDIFTRLWQKKQDISAISNIKAFLYTSVRNACLDLLRRQNRHQDSHREIKYLSEQGEFLAINEEIFSKVLQHLYKEIEQLPPQCRSIFKLLYFKGLSTQQVAEQLNLSAQTVRNQKTRAIQLLRASLGEKDPFLFSCFVSLFVLSMT